MLIFGKKHSLRFAKIRKKIDVAKFGATPCCASHLTFGGLAQAGGGSRLHEIFIVGQFARTVQRDDAPLAPNR
jgi:hypothetical protein